MLESLGLLTGHLLGDYVLQTDWQAANKSNPHPGRRPGCVLLTGHHIPSPLDDKWQEASRLWRTGHVACTIHCLLYTLAVWVCSYWWMPAWGLAVCFFAHWAIDRFRLAGWWMRHVAGQKYFASPDHPMFPMSIVLVDNAFHVLTLFLIGLTAL